jgi:hypothetical protein
LLHPSHGFAFLLVRIDINQQDSPKHFANFSFVWFDKRPDKQMNAALLELMDAVRG